MNSKDLGPSSWRVLGNSLVNFLRSEELSHRAKLEILKRAKSHDGMFESFL